MSQYFNNKVIFFLNKNQIEEFGKLFKKGKQRNLQFYILFFKLLSVP